MQVSCDDELEELAARQAAGAASAAHEATELARQLRSEGEQQLDQAEQRPAGDASRLRSLGRASIACADQLLQLAECQRGAAEAAAGVLDRCLDPGRTQGP